MIMHCLVDYSTLIRGDAEMIDSRIKALREAANITQAELAKKLGITRSSVNAWEMGISAPSTQYLVELSLFFKVSTDYLLGLSHDSSLELVGLDDEQTSILVSLAEQFRKQNRNSKIK